MARVIITGPAKTMSYQLPPEIDQRIQAQIALGIYQTPTEVLTDALDAFDQRNEDIASIQRGIEDERTGRLKTLEEFDRDIRQQFGFTSPG